MRLKKILYLLIILLFYLSSCRTTSTPTDVHVPSIDWLENPICTPPCWADITPGQTSMEDALSKLAINPEVTITFQSEDDIVWQLKDAKEGAGTLSAENGVISFMRVGISLIESVNLEKVINIYGSPDYVKPYDCRDGMCAAVLIYPDSGMFLDTFIKDTGTANSPKIEILPETKVKSVYFFQPGMKNFQKLIAFQDYDLLFDWHGYGEYG